MTELATLDAYAVAPDAATLKIQRFLPGPIERCWAYLTDSDLRRQWLASGVMEMKLDSPFELTWRNSELTDPPGQLPEGFPAEHSMQSRIVELDPPHKLTFTWGAQQTGEVTFTLEPKGDEVLLTVIHRRIPDRSVMLNASAGWHAHLDMLVASMNGRTKTSFWDGWARLKTEYDRRLPA